ncbi:hypothetical protein D9611_014221 [Ephemerocybe angulata]|uniref:Uncharacterized protein n=1 Tax=Ephemerocybe angulata TaxID=980116 RepID=A0A8H5EZP6_9AGAR|nr:hypothetical protein D9611_014221 [Tulosesus angulatus]
MAFASIPPDSAVASDMLTKSIPGGVGHGNSIFVRALVFGAHTAQVVSKFQFFAMSQPRASTRSVLGAHGCMRGHGTPTQDRHPSSPPISNPFVSDILLDTRMNHPEDKVERSLSIFSFHPAHPQYPAPPAGATPLPQLQTHSHPATPPTSSEITKNEWPPAIQDAF